MYLWIKNVSRRDLKINIPKFRVGDTIRIGIATEVHRQRLQIFEGTLVA
jgi:ribosomal protein L19